MFWNYMRIAYRSSKKNKVTSIINILGLALSVAACLLIATYVQHESSYDSWVTDAGNIYRMYGEYKLDGKTLKGTHFSANTAVTVKEDFDEIVTAGRFMDNELFYGAGENIIRWDGEKSQHREDGFTYVDQELLTLLDLPMIYGDNEEALAMPKTIVISQSKAEKYFDQKNPVGKTLYLNENIDDPFTISGVMQDLPSNSHIDYDFLITLTDVEFGEGEQTRWTQNNYFTYVKIKSDVVHTQLQNAISDRLINEYMVPAMAAQGDPMAEEMKNLVEFKLQPLSDIHLYSRDISDTYTRGDIRFVWLFAIVGCLILLIAGVNFVNLSTARSAIRAKEVGMRKVLGSHRKQLVSQFLSESVLITMVAFAVGALAAQLVLPFFNKMVGEELVLPFSSPLILCGMIISAIVIGLLAGAYPSLYLSRFKPISVFGGEKNRGSGSSILRQSLVVFQFTTSIVLIAFTLIAQRQFDFILDREVGYERDQVIQLNSTDVLGDQVTSFRDEVENLPGVVSASISDYLPIADTKRNGNTFYNENRTEIDRGTPGQAWIVDRHYLPTLGVQLLQGRNFREQPVEGQNYVIVNEAMVRKLGLDSPIGKKIQRGNRKDEIIGVVRDFEYFLFNEDVQPLALFPGISPTMMSVKIAGGNLPSTLASLEKTWQAFGARMDMEYTFMDESFARMHAKVEQVRTLFSGFAILAIFIACLGLFALSAFVVERRQKEMSIRKVLGASSQGLFSLLTRQFVVLNIIALVLAVPIATYFIRRWLQDYSHRIEISWDVFAISAGIALLLTMTTISYHALRAIFANPIESLRDE